jgi:valyl-tRNA synthetase
MLSKAYDPKGTEDRIYRVWEDSGAFEADVESDKEPFTVSMPPPNATGELHLGHSVMLALEDIFIRYARMKGSEALWVPGTDHAAIATESVVIKQIQRDEKIPDPRASLGREKLLERIAAYVDKSQDTIRSQVRKMGASCDWSRERYTFEPALNRLVNEVFKKMYEDGLIYRGERVINWDPALQTTISDDEIIYEDREATLYTIKYLTEEVTGGNPVYVSTSRPETKLGDAALVVHPDDKRYVHLIGRHFSVDWPRDQKIHVTVIADHSIDPDFGTGVLGLTPLHSKTDYELWQRHKDDISAEPIHVINEQGKITDAIDGYAGLSVTDCRAQFVEDLRQDGRIEKEESYVQPLSLSYRSKRPIEPLPKRQWFIDVNKKAVSWDGKTMSFKEVMLHVIRSKDIEIIPSHFEKTYFHWIENLQDWCISRQIWWGHQVPVWYKGDEIYVGTEMPDGAGWEQDPDTLDTWFSSALWTWSTLVDKDLTEDFSLSLYDLLQKSPDYKKFHPTNVMETGYDILFFWVARMILMTTYATGEVPFKTVYLHGLIRTRDGAKMSKSHPETMINPLDIIPKYGADALRLSMIVGQSPGNDSKLYEEKIAGYRNFINKLWNASRFVLMQCPSQQRFENRCDPDSAIFESRLRLADRAVLHALQELVKDVTDGLTHYRLSEVGERLYSFVWDYFCDWYLELSKGEVNPEVLVHCMRTILKLLHPYCPFVTEELWDSFKPEDSGLLIKEEWPSVDIAFKNQDSFQRLQVVIDVITAIRKIRPEQGIEPDKKISVTIVSKDYQSLLESQKEHIIRLGRLRELTITRISDSTIADDDVASAFLGGIEVHVSLEGLVDLDSLKKEKLQLEPYIDGLTQKLSNKEFVSHAPKEVVKQEREKLTDAQERLQKIEERLG